MEGIRHELIATLKDKYLKREYKEVHKQSQNLNQVEFYYLITSIIPATDDLDEEIVLNNIFYCGR